MKLIKTSVTFFKEIGLLSLVALALLGSNYAFGAWTNPPSAPPNPNVALPVNTGSATQIKTGQFIISNTSPRIELLETDAQGSRIINSNSYLYFQVNRGTTLAPTWDTMLRLSSPDSPIGKTTLSYGQMRAPAYCNTSGGECVTTADVQGNTTRILDLEIDFASLGGAPAAQTPTGFIYTKNTTRTNSTSQPMYLYIRSISLDLWPAAAMLYLRSPGGSWVYSGNVSKDDQDLTSLTIPPGYSYRIDNYTDLSSSYMAYFYIVEIK